MYGDRNDVAPALSLSPQTFRFRLNKFYLNKFLQIFEIGILLFLILVKSYTQHSHFEIENSSRVLLPFSFRNWLVV